MTKIMLSAHGLVCGYRQDNDLTGALDFNCLSGEVMAILGINGRGKTTLLHTLMGTQPPLAGYTQSQGDIGFVPQIFSLTFSYSVLDIVLMGRARQVGLLNLPSHHDIEMAREALSLLNIHQLAECNFNDLSGGQRQLVLIARALAMQCKILILDEPTAALDLKNQALVLHLIHQLAHKQGLSVIFTTHDPAHAVTCADTALLLLDNKRYLFGERNLILTEQNLSELYHLPVRQVRVENAGRTFNTLVPLFDIYSSET